MSKFWRRDSLRSLVARLAVESGAARVLCLGPDAELQLLELERQGLAAVGADFFGTALSFAPGEFDLSILSFTLRVGREEAFRLLDEALRVSSRLFALDFGLPERNLDYPAHFSVRLGQALRGRSHYAAYKQYMRLGALEGLLDRYRRERAVRIAWRERVFFNTMLLMQVE